MIDTLDPVQEAAVALLATVKKLLTGREIAACEWAKSGDMAEELESAIRSKMRDDCMDIYDAEKLARREFEELRVLQSLQNQFSREIGNWLNKRNATYSRRAVRK